MASRQAQSGFRKSKMNSIISTKISPAESAYRSTHYPDVSSISTTRLSCTKCDCVIKPRMVTENNVHPVLEVLLCRKCRHFYDQRQSQDKQLCAWCANDQTILFGCSSCSAKFCEGCINRNFRLARTIFQQIDEGKWKCCVCFSIPIWPQRATCAAAKMYADTSNNALKERIAKCNAVRNSAKPVSTRNQSTSHTVTTQPITFGASHPRPSVASVSKPEKKLELVTTIILAGAVSAAEKQPKKEPNTCVICLLNPPIMVMYPCGHKCLCKQCSEVLPLREKLCPLCRRPFRDIIRLYE